MKLRLSEEERAERDEQVRISRKKYEAQLDRHAREVVRQGKEHADRRIKIAEDMQDFFEQKLKQALAQRDWYMKRDKSMWKQIAEHHKAGERIEAACRPFPPRGREERGREPIVLRPCLPARSR